MILVCVECKNFHFFIKSDSCQALFHHFLFLFLIEIGHSIATTISIGVTVYANSKTKNKKRNSYKMVYRRHSKSSATRQANKQNYQQKKKTSCESIGKR